MRKIATHVALSVAAFALCLSVNLGITHLTTPVEAQAPGSVSTTSVYEGFAHEALTVSTTAVGFTTATYAPANAVSARQAFCHVETADVRYSYHGTNPTASTMHPAAAGTTFTVYGTNNIRNFRAIREDGSDATLRCTFAR